MNPNARRLLLLLALAAPSPAHAADRPRKRESEVVDCNACALRCANTRGCKSSTCAAVCAKVDECMRKR